MRAKAKRRTKPAAQAKPDKRPAGLVTRAEAARELGVEPNRINKWASDGAPVAVAGSRGHASWYDLAALRKWRDSRAENNGLTISLSEQKTRVQAAMAERMERENQVRAGQLVPVAEAIAQGQGHITAAKTRLLKVARTCVLRGLPREFEALVHGGIVEALRELAQWHPEVGESKAS